MRFDLKQFLRSGREPFTAALRCDLAGRDWPGYELDGPVSGQFRARLAENGKAQLSLWVSARAKAPCARCLETAVYPCELRRDWSVGPGELAKNEWELPIGPEGVLDIDELVFQELVLEIPPVLLCSPDCQGLCPVCGKPRAAGCSCGGEAETAANHGLAILKELLSEDLH